MIVAISMMRDEEDICGQTVAHLLAEGVDRLIIADNLSVDGTRYILESFPEVTVVDDAELAFYQSAKMTTLMHQALDLGATWVVPFDADEFWYAHNETLREAFARQPDSVSSLWADIYQQWGDNRGPGPQPFHKVAFRPSRSAVIRQGNHDVERLDGQRLGDTLAIRECQYRSVEQFIRKVRNGKAAYDASTLGVGEGAHWRYYGAQSDEWLTDEYLRLQAIPLEWDPIPTRIPSEH